MSLFLLKFFHIVDSADRISGTTNNFTINIPMPTDNHYNRILVNSAVIPKSFYLIRDGYNTFTLKEGTNLWTITIPIGNYTLTEFTVAIQALLDDHTFIAFTYIITFSKRLGKFVFTVSANAGVQPSFIFTTNVFETLGFEKNSTNLFVADTITSSNIINLNPNEIIYICSDLVNNSKFQILEAIPMCNIPDYSYQYYQNTSTHTIKELTNNRNQTFTFQIKDSFHRLLDLNGKNIVFTLCIHKEDNTNELIKESLLLHNEDTLQARKENSLNIDLVPNLDETNFVIGFKS